MPVSTFASLLLAFGVVMGLVGDLLLNVRPWGVNLPLWCTGTAAAFLWTYRATGARVTPRIAVRLALWVGISWLFSWRDADALRAFNLAALAAATGR